MKVNFGFQFVFDFDDEIPAVKFEELIASVLAEKGIDVSRPIFQKDGDFVAIFREKINDDKPRGNQ